MEKQLSELVAELMAAIAGAAGTKQDAAMVIAVTPVTVGFARLAERFVAAQEKQADMLMFLAKAAEGIQRIQEKPYGGRPPPRSETG